MEDKELIELITKETKPLFEEQFINGCLAGWNACIKSILAETKNIHNCKEMKKIIKNKYKMEKGDNNGNDQKE